MTAVRKVVCIEDEAEMLQLVTLVLRQRQCQVIGVATGRDGLAYFATEKPDLILLDLALPDMDGWDVYHQLKAIPAMRDVPVIVLTSKADNIDRILGLQIAQVDGYLAKPFDANQLLRQLDRVLLAPPAGPTGA